jgi:hypothetical protein
LREGLMEGWAEAAVAHAAEAATAATGAAAGALGDEGCCEKESEAKDGED